MIANVPNKRKDGGSSFNKLLSYMRYDVSKETGEIVADRGEPYISDSCLDASIVAKEMMIVASMNHRVVDPVYHFVLSWAPGEKPTNEQWQESVRQTVKSLGLAEHQWCAIPHDDTAIRHVHVAINRIHPVTYKAHAPEWAHYSLDETLRNLEKQFGWNETRGLYRWDETLGKPVKTEKELLAKWREERELSGRAATGKAQKMEIYSDAESLMSYCKSNPAKRLNELVKKQGGSLTWQRIHAELASFGLRLIPSEKGGFTVSNTDSSIHVRASQAFRNLFAGKPAQQWREQNLGAFEAPDEVLLNMPTKEQYKTGRVSKRDPALREQRKEDRREARQDLLKRYKLAQNKFDKKALPEYRFNKKLLDQKIIDLRGVLRNDKAEIRKSMPAGRSRQIELGMLVASYETRVANLKIQLKTAKEASKFIQRDEWTAQQAELGDGAAIAYLRGLHYAEQRRRKEAEQEAENAIKPAVPGQYYPSTNAFTNISWRFDRASASVVYTIGNKTAFTDRGNCIDLAAPHEITDEVILAALRLAQGKYGQKLTVAGSTEFQQRVALLAAENRLRIEFSDPAMQQIMIQPKAPAKPIEIVDQIERVKDGRANIGNIANNLRAASANLETASHHVDDIERTGVSVELTARNQHYRRVEKVVGAVDKELRGISEKIARTLRAGRPVLDRLIALKAERALAAKKARADKVREAAKKPEQPKPPSLAELKELQVQASREGNKREWARLDKVIKAMSGKGKGPSNELGR